MKTSYFSKKITAAAALGTAALGLSAHSAKAAVVISSTRASNVSFNNGTYDVITFYIDSLTGADATKGTNAGNSQDAEVLGIGGVFTAVPATGSTAVLGVPGSTTSGAAQYYENYSVATAAPQVTGTFAGSNPNGTASSYTNFRSTTGSGTLVGSANASGSKSAINGTATSFSDNWFTTPGTGNGNVGGVEPGKDPNSVYGNDAFVTRNTGGFLAEMLVTPGANVSFTGTVSDYGFTNGAPLSFSSAAVTTPTPTPTTTPIISLTASAPTGFGNNLGTLALTGRNGSYPAQTTAPFTAVSAGYVGVTGFNPATDPEIYGLAVLDSSTASTTADLAALVAAINNGAYTDANGTTLTASLRTDASNATLGYLPAADDIIIRTVGTGGTTTSPFFGFNFSSVSGVTGTLTVNSVTAVPEPTSIAALAVGAAGLLVGRRRNKRTA